MAELFSDLVRAPGEAQGRWASDAWRIGVDVAAVYADDVDVNARFPHETIAALKESRFLSAMLPAELGGGDASLADMVAAVRALGAHCVSSALVLAMHCIEIVNLNRHGDSPGLRELSREVAQSELLIANANSEVGLGGDVGRSRGPCTRRRSPSPTARTPTFWWPPHATRPTRRRPNSSSASCERPTCD